MSAPDGGFAALTPELAVSDLPASLAFWCGLLGFAVAYDRPGFAYLQMDGVQVMLCDVDKQWEVGPLARPFGRGVNFQFRVAAVGPLLERLAAAGFKLFEAPHDAWYRAGEIEVGQRQFLVQDPDGYLLRPFESLGTRPLGTRS